MYYNTNQKPRKPSTFLSYHQNETEYVMNWTYASIIRFMALNFVVACSPYSLALSHQSYMVQ